MEAGSEMACLGDLEMRGEHRERQNWGQKHLASAHDGTADARPVLISAMYTGAEEFCRLAASIEDVRMISARG